MGKKYLKCIYAAGALLAILVFASFLAFTGSATFEDSIVFEPKEGWNLSQGFARISLNSQIIDVPLNVLINDTKIVIEPHKLNLSSEDGILYADIILNGIVADSQKFSVNANSLRDTEAEQALSMVPTPKIRAFDNITAETKQKVIIKVKENKQMIKEKFGAKESIDTNLLFAEANSSEISEIGLDENVIEIWPDRETVAFLGDSVPQINAPAQWGLGYYGANVTIAILDTGVNASHPMLQGRVILSRDFTGSGDANDYNGHGTHVAGIAAGDSSYKGVAPKANLINAKVLNDYGSGQISWMIDAIGWAMDPDGNPLTDDGADIISLSLGATYFGNAEELLSSPEVMKVEEAVSNGIIVAIASGNCGQGCGGFVGVTTPGIARNAITVGAVDSSNNHASFSSGGFIADYTKPDVVAPGVDVCSSYLGGYKCLSGTSMSTPHVSGAAALLLEAGVSPYDVKNVLENNALDLGAVGKDTEFGSGLINLGGSRNEAYEGNNYWLNVPVFKSGSKDDIVLTYNNSFDEAAKGKKIRVKFDLEEFDSHNVIEEEKEVPSGKSKEFKIGWQPSLPGQYLLIAEIYADDLFAGRLVGKVMVANAVEDTVVKNQVMWT